MSKVWISLEKRWNSVDVEDSLEWILWLNLKRNLKGENRILIILTTKGLIYTGIGLVIGLPFFFIFKLLTSKFLLRAIIPLLTAAIGYVIGSFKIPDTKSIKLFKNVGGETIDEVLRRYFRFNGNFSSPGKKIYVYNTKEEEECSLNN